MSVDIFLKMALTILSLAAIGVATYVGLSIRPLSVELKQIQEVQEQLEQKDEQFENMLFEVATWRAGVDVKLDLILREVSKTDGAK